MAGWDQTPGGTPLQSDLDPYVLLTTEDESEVLYGEDAGGWLALTLAKTASVGAWAQDATWDASLTEDLEGSAGWTQDATWEATGLHAEPITAEATFEQTATWSAEALHAEAGEVTATAEWAQESSWAAEGQAAVEEPVSPRAPFGIRIRPAQRNQPRLTPIPPVFAAASFSQAPAAWDMELTVDRTPVDLEELILVGAL